MLVTGIRYVEVFVGALGGSRYAGWNHVRGAMNGAGGIEDIVLRAIWMKKSAEASEKAVS
jgi:hypothetical protein